MSPELAVLLFVALVVAGVLISISAVSALMRARERGRIDRGRREVGRRAEEAVAAKLSVLPRYGRYHVFNGLREPGPDARGDIDHLVVGPAGVCVVETKSHQGDISADFSRNPPLLLRNGAPITKGDDTRAISVLRQLDNELREVMRVAVHPFKDEWAEKRHGTPAGGRRGRRGPKGPWVDVEGRVCFPRGRPVPNAQGRYPPRVVAQEELLSEITALPPKLSDEDVDHLADVVRRNYRRPASASP